VPAVVTAGLETIVVRFPAHPVAQKLILECGFPLAAPSVNPSGKPSSTHHQHVLDYFEDSLFVIADNSSSIGLESTVISTLVDPPVILRQGAITKEDIEQVIHLPVLLVSHSSHQKPLSPGQKFRHYSPKAPIEIIPLSPTSSIEVNIHQKALEHLSFGRKVGALIAEETTPSLPSDVVSFVLGPRDNLSLISSRLYAGLHNFDLTDVDIILVESFPEDGLGATIMDRFYRAAQIH
jgi:L-threonylcarbamoyladenylate synthase